MDLYTILTLPVVGLGAGWAAGRFLKIANNDLPTYFAIGLPGYFVGNHLLALLGLVAVNIIGRLVAAMIGGMICVWLYRVWQQRTQGDDS